MYCRLKFVVVEGIEKRFCRKEGEGEEALCELKRPQKQKLQFHALSIIAASPPSIPPPHPPTVGKNVQVIVWGGGGLSKWFNKCRDTGTNTMAWGGGGGITLRRVLYSTLYYLP
jgi:hypothetical protein